MIRQNGDIVFLIIMIMMTQNVWNDQEWKTKSLCLTLKSLF